MRSRHFVFKCACGDEIDLWSARVSSAIDYVRDVGWTIDPGRNACPLCIARSIWPTGKPAKPDAQVPFAFAYPTVRVGRTHVEAGPFSYSKRVLVCERGRIDIGIAEGRRLARERMRRFRLWLAERQAPASLRYASEHAMSPEAVVLAADGLAVRWVAWECHVLEHVSAMLMRSGDTKAAARFIVGFEEWAPVYAWAALPWQREAP